MKRKKKLLQIINRHKNTYKYISQRFKKKMIFLLLKKQIDPKKFKNLK